MDESEKKIHLKKGEYYLKDYMYNTATNWKKKAGILIKLDSLF